jgi:hypothetical protein
VIFDGKQIVPVKLRKWLKAEPETIGKLVKN